MISPASIDAVIRKTEAAVTLEQLRGCVLDVLLIVAQQNAELNNLHTRKPAIAGALSAFQTKHKDRVRK